MPEVSGYGPATSIMLQKPEIVRQAPRLERRMFSPQHRGVLRLFYPRKKLETTWKAIRS